MMIPKSKSTLITIIIHILIWGILGLIYFSQPLLLSITLPYQLWIKQIIIWGLLITAFYLNSFILVPKFLLKNNTGIYFLLVLVIVAVIVILNVYVDKWLNLHQLMEAAFHKSGPPKHRKGRDYNWDLAMIATIALVLGITGFGAG
jgi:two-component system LytT family sensor kinase